MSSGPPSYFEKAVLRTDDKWMSMTKYTSSSEIWITWIIP